MKIANHLQRVLMPNAQSGSSDSMYVNGVSYIHTNDELTVFPGGRVSLDTYYNAFSTDLWKRKCGISDVSFFASGSGKVNFKLMLLTEELVKYEITRRIVELRSEINEVLSVNLDEVENRGIIYIEMISIGDEFTFSYGEWITKQSPLRSVKLGISITHFDRKKYVIPSIIRIKKEILEDEDYSEVIDFTVVDNSQNITEDEASGTRVIPNKNTGGTGGFMRGLLHYKDEGDFTHVLFMDDDASCEIESIKKTYSILSYAINDNSAVAGSLFMETKPEVLIEKGAIFDRVCRPIFNGWNLNNPSRVVWSETFIQQPNYGGWWFFAFPIKNLKYMAFPFFVRGDDILFSMMNDFNIITTNGVASYAEDFSTKVSPSTWYLDTRNHMLNMFFFKAKKIDLMKTYSSYFLSCLLSHQYGSAKAVRLALNHVLGDSDFWKKNVDMSSVRHELSEISKSERMMKIEVPKKIIHFKNNNESKIRKIIRIFSFNGAILPCKNKIIYQNKSYRACLRQIFRYKKIFYYNKYNGTGYISTESKISIFNGFIGLSVDLFKILTTGKKQTSKIQHLVNDVTNDEFWISELKLKE